MRFIHAADLHLDTAFVARSDAIRKRLRDSSREALRHLVDLALAEEVDAVIIAGDLFDGKRISFPTERILANEMHRLAEAAIPVVYATGNHDPGQTGSRAAALEWPANVRLASGPEPIRVAISDEAENPIGSITAVGHAHSEIQEDLTPHFPPPSGAGAHVAVLHGTVVGSANAVSHERYAPADIGALQRAGYHYWALGHIHEREELLASPGIHYPGNTQGRSIRECGRKGCLVVDLSQPDTPQVTHHRLGSIQWEHLRLDDIQSCHTVDGLIHATTEAWRAMVSEYADDPPTDWIVRVTLSGPSPLFTALTDADGPADLAEEMRDALGVLEVEVRSKGVFPPVRLADHVERKDVLGEALRLVHLTREEGWSALEEDVLAGLEAGADPERYVAELLIDAEAEILARMLKPGSGAK
jgi:DNA repair protein SbcD/Mre11